MSYTIKITLPPFHPRKVYSSYSVLIQIDTELIVNNDFFGGDQVEF